MPRFLEHLVRDESRVALEHRDGEAGGREEEAPDEVELCDRHADRRRWTVMVRHFQGWSLLHEAGYALRRKEPARAAARARMRPGRALTVSPYSSAVCAASGERALVRPDVRLGEDADKPIALFDDQKAVELVLSEQSARLVDFEGRLRRHEIRGRDLVDRH